MATRLIDFLCGCFELEKDDNVSHIESWANYNDSNGNTSVIAHSVDTSTPYDVFLCHRGPDTKETIVDVLYRSLTDRGISCFVDYKMEKGTFFPDLILRAIRNSKVHVVFLSERFTESSWCLNEVSEMMKLQHSKQASDISGPPFVLPIFYGVDPADVQHQRPGSAYDLSKLQKSADKQKKSQWSQGLRDIAKRFNGIEKKNKFEGELIQEIVVNVEKFLSETMECYIDPEQESLFSDQLRKAEGALLFCDDKFPVTSIGIIGQNRSDFANILFKKFSRHFSASCLLSNVLEHAKNPEGLRELQTRLYSELMPRSNGHPPSIYNTDRGRDLLLDRLKNMKSFIVLDDIGDDMQQLRSLLILDKHRLGKGSRMVLTSRYPHVLDNMAKADVVIDVSTTIKEDTFRDSFKRLVICCESEDVDVGFIKHLMESFSMLGLYVSLTRGNEILDVAHDVQSAMVLVILSRGFNIESPHVRSTLSEVNTLLGDKVLYISYGQQQLPAIQLDANSSGEQRALYRTISRKGLTFSPNFQDLTSGLETGKFKSLVNDILERMNHTCKFRAFTDYPVALIERQQRIENEISECLTKRKQYQYFGIVGMGGMGKTTVAMSLFNKFHNKFEGSVFLENIRAQASRGSSALGSLQKLILCTVLGGENKEGNIMSVQEGKSFLSSKLRGTNTLIILDDVDNTEQLKSLLDPLDLGTGSVVVITSRDRGLLTLHKVNMIFELDLLREEDAQSLFYWHAFLKPSPPLALKGIAEQLVNACQGLPLSLQVIGAHVFGHVDPDFWNETLNYIKNAGKEIFDLLRVTVDALEDYQREAFLDVCCFLVGMSQQTAQRVWNGCGLDAKTCIYVLKSKCLMTVDPKHDVIRMHDQIRDMGRYIAKQRRPRTHIWDVQLDVRDSALGSQDLHGLAWIARDEDDAQLSGCALESLYHAKILLLQNVKIEEDFPDKCYYNGLRWLQWLRSPFISLPRGLCRSNLRVLDLSGSPHLTTLLAEGNSTLFKELRRLQELNLGDCKSLRELPPLQFLSSLEWLSLKGCEHVQNLDSGIGTLTRLRFLDLRQCKALQYLPSEIRCLGLLEKLFLSDCVSLEYLPEGLGECINLTELYLDHTGLTTLTESLCMLENLEVMIVSGCHNLACLPENFGNLRSLTICNFKDCSKLRQLPYTFCELKEMEELDLSSCDLHELPEAIGNLCKLKSLVLFNNPSLRRLPPSIGALSSLKVLDMHSCPLQDDGIPEGLRNMQNLEEMILQDTNLRKVPSCLEHLHKLHTLNLRGCKDLEEASFFPSSLRVLDISQCPCLRRLNNLDAAKSLWRLFASNCYELRTINGLDGPTHLELLDIAGCKRLYTTAARGLEGSNIRQFCLSGSHVLPSPKLLQLPDLGHITYFGSKLPSPFTNSILSEVNNEEHANILLMSIDTAFSTSCNAKSCDVAMVMCFVSHDQGWSDFPKEYSSYTLSPTFVEAVLYRQGWKVGTVQLLYRNRHAEIRDQVHLVVLRHGCPLLRLAEEGDKIEVRARSVYQAWRITVKKAAYEVFNGSSENSNAFLRDVLLSSMNQTACTSSETCCDEHVPRNIQALTIDLPVKNRSRMWPHEYIPQSIHEKIDSLTQRLSGLVRNFDLDIQHSLQRDVIEWRRNRQTAIGFLLRERSLCFDHNDHETIGSQCITLLQAWQQVDVPIVPMFWRASFLLHYDTSMDHRCLPSIAEMTLGSALAPGITYDSTILACLLLGVRISNVRDQDHD